MKKLWQSKLVAKFFLSYLTIVLVLFAFFYFYSRSLITNFYILSLSEKMHREANLVSHLLPSNLAGAEFDDTLRKLASDLKVRLTIIQPDGRVLGDSDDNSAAMENHGTRPEVIEARARGSGKSIRYSTTVKSDMFYHAALQGEGSNARIIRVAVPLSTVEAAIGSIRKAILLGLLLASALGLLLAYLFSRQLGRRFQRLAELSRHVAQGEFPALSFSNHGKDELGDLERNLYEMSRSIQEKLKATLAEKEKVESILKCMSEGVLAVDTQGRIILTNENAQKMFNAPLTHPLYGVSYLEISRHPEMKRLMQEIMTCDCSRECFTKEIALDEGKWFMVNAVSLRDGEQKPLGYVMVFHDVTELKRLETIRSDFVANVSHELRTPLTAIRGYAETLLRSPPPDLQAAEHFLGIIQHHSERLGRLIDDLLALSDLESGKIQISKEKLPATELIGRVLEIFRDQAHRKEIALSQKIHPDLPPILGDLDRLQQLLINLIDNAVKYTSSGGQIQVSASLASSGGHQAAMVEVAVADTGCGIPEKDLPRLTERFYRVDRARSRELGGTGLGLAIVKHIVQAHGGLFKVESQLQKGTTVRVFLPSAGVEARPRGVLFLCTANSCRSQMAEGFARKLAPQGIQVYSAGTEPKAIDPLAIKVMQEKGFDISDQESKGLDAIPLDKIALVVTLCGEATESCPTFPKDTEHLHWPVRDPALAEGTSVDVLRIFREVRDDIRDRVEQLIAARARFSQRENQQTHHDARAVTK